MFLDCLSQRCFALVGRKFSLPHGRRPIFLRLKMSPVIKCVLWFRFNSLPLTRRSLEEERQSSRPLGETTGSVEVQARGARLSVCCEKAGHRCKPRSCPCRCYFSPTPGPQNWRWRRKVTEIAVSTWRPCLKKRVWHSLVELTWTVRWFSSMANWCIQGALPHTITFQAGVVFQCQGTRALSLSFVDHMKLLQIVHESTKYKLHRGGKYLVSSSNPPAINHDWVGTLVQVVLTLSVPTSLSIVIQHFATSPSAKGKINDRQTNPMGGSHFVFGKVINCMNILWIRKDKCSLWQNWPKKMSPSCFRQLCGTAYHRGIASCIIVQLRFEAPLS